MTITGKTGADAIFHALKRICLVLAKYQTKLLAATEAAEGLGLLTLAQGDAIRAFVAASNGICTAFDILAKYSSIN